MIRDASGRESGAVRQRALEERERLAQAAGGIATFLWDLASSKCEVTPQIAVLFGFGRDDPTPSFADWQRAIFADDFLKLRAAVEGAARTGSFYAEFRVRGADGGVRWIAGKGEAGPGDGGGRPRPLRRLSRIHTRQQRHGPVAVLHQHHRSRRAR